MSLVIWLANGYFDIPSLRVLDGDRATLRENEALRVAFAPFRGRKADAQRSEPMVYDIDRPEGLKHDTDGTFSVHFYKRSDGVVRISHYGLAAGALHNARAFDALSDAFKPFRGQRRTARRLKAIYATLHAIVQVHGGFSELPGPYTPGHYVSIQNPRRGR